MRSIIWGIGNYSNKLRIYLEKYKNDIDVVAYVDNNKSFYGDFLDGHQIISVQEIPSFIMENHIDCIIVATNSRAQEMIRHQLYMMKVNCEVYGIVDDDAYINGKAQVGDLLKRFEMMKDGRPSIPYLQYDLVRHCNLNCNSCAAFANIMEPSFRGKETFIKDFSRLAELYYNIDDIRLMGGEPFLHPDLYFFIYKTRELFPRTNLYIVTNGILVTQMAKKTLLAIQTCDAILDISLYLPTFKIWADLYGFIVDHNIRYRMSPPINNFYKSFDLTHTISGKAKFDRCLARRCRMVHNGYMATCGMPLSKHIYEKLEEKFGVKLPFYADGKIDIHNKMLDGWKLNELLDKPLPSCDYCAVGLMDFKKRNDSNWKKWRCGKKPEFDDWC